MKNERGSFSILAAFSILGVIAFLLFIFDVGIKFHDQSKLDDASDFAAQSAVKFLDGTETGLTKAKENVLNIFKVNGFNQNNLSSIEVGTVDNSGRFVLGPIKTANALKVNSRKINNSIILTFASPAIGNKNYEVFSTGAASSKVSKEFVSGIQTDNLFLDKNIVKNNKNNLLCNDSFVISTRQNASICHGNKEDDLLFRKSTNFSSKTINTQIGQQVLLNEMSATDLVTALTSSPVNNAFNYSSNETIFEKIVPIYETKYDSYSYSNKNEIVGYANILIEKLNQTDFSVTLQCNGNSSVLNRAQGTVKFSSDPKNNFGTFKETKQSKLIRTN